MPTNLPPEYYEAERKFKEAISPKAKADSLEELISTIPKHKGTDKLRAELRRKLSKLKTQSQSKKQKGKYENHFHIEKEGAARIIVLGAANVGKSSLVAKLSHAHPEISENPFTTWAPAPGMADIEGIQLQLIDTPAIDRDYIEPEFLDLIKSADLIILMLDLQAYPIQQFQKSIEILESNRIFAAYKKHLVEEQRATFIPFLTVTNKDDAENLDEDFEVLSELLAEEGWYLLPISVKTGRNLETMTKRIIKKLKLIRVYSNPPGSEADRGQPFVLREGCNIGDFAKEVHKDFYEKLKLAKIWGTGVHDGQLVGKDHVLIDEDVVELHI